MRIFSGDLEDVALPEQKPRVLELVIASIIFAVVVFVVIVVIVAVAGSCVWHFSAVVFCYLNRHLLSCRKRLGSSPMKLFRSWVEWDI